MFSEKHAKYLLPTYPAIALLLAWQWVDLLKSREGWQRQLMIGLPLVVLVGFVIFYSIFEGKIFAYRVQALPEISQLTSEHSDLPIYSLGQPDMRLVYYVGHPIKRLAEDAVMPHSATDALLFVKANYLNRSGRFRTA